MSKTYKFNSEIIVPLPLEEVFVFFSNPANLIKITPSWLNFSINTPQPVKMDLGTLIDFRINVLWITIKWQSKITSWMPPDHFEDIQIRGPYKVWNHRHSFRKVKEGTLIRDEVQYIPKGGLLAPFLNFLFFKWNINQIFKYRTKKL